MIDFRERLSNVRNLIDLLSMSSISEPINNAITEIAAAILNGKPLLVCGNGGSASDALHISGELVGRFLIDRRAFDVVCLNANVSVMTAWSNDYDYSSVFARQVEAHGRVGGVILGLSTSGNSSNVVKAFQTAQSLGMTAIALTGKTGGALAGLADILINVPSSETPRVQELHVLIYHYICEAVEMRVR